MPRPYALCVTGDLPVANTLHSLLPHIQWKTLPSWELAPIYIENHRRTLTCLVVNLDQLDNLQALQEVNRSHPDLTLYGIIQPGQEALGYHAMKVGLFHPTQVLSWPLEENEVLSAFKVLARNSWMTRVLKYFPLLPSSKESDRASGTPLVFPPNLPARQGREEDHKGNMPPSSPESVLRMSLLGELSMSYNGQVIEQLPNRKLLSIWVYLLLNGNKPIRRDTLMEVFWKGVGKNSAKNSLHNAISKLRKYLKQLDPDQEFILLKRDCYYLSPKVQVLTDLNAFTRALKKGKNCEIEKDLEGALSQYSHAYRMYKGPFFAHNQQDDWVVEENAYLVENYKLLLDRISHYYSNNGNPDLAIGFCKEILQLDSCREDIHRRVMRCYYRLQMRDQALRQLEQCKLILGEEFGPRYELSPETIQLAERIQRG